MIMMIDLMDLVGTKFAKRYDNDEPKFKNRTTDQRQHHHHEPILIIIESTTWLEIICLHVGMHLSFFFFFSFFLRSIDENHHHHESWCLV